MDAYHGILGAGLLGELAFAIGYARAGRYVQSACVALMFAGHVLALALK